MLIIRWIRPRGDSLAAALLSMTGHHGNFLELRHTREWFKAEQHLPSEVIDRGSVRAWTEAGERDAAARARSRVVELVESYRYRPLEAGVGKELRAVVERAARRSGMETLPMSA